MAYTPHTWTAGETIDATKLNANEAGTQAAAAAADTANTALAGKVNSSTYTAGLAAKADASSLATVATSGAYSDLSGKPTIPAAYSDAQAVAAVAAGGDSAVASQVTSGTATQAALKAAFVPRWAANTAYTTGDAVLNPSGQIVTANATFTSGSSYSASNWTVVSGGGGTVSDATTTTKGIVQLAGDLAGTAAAPTVPGLAAKLDKTAAVALASAGQETLTQTPSTTSTAADAGHTHRLPNADGNGDVSLYSADGTLIKLHVSGGAVGGSTSGGSLAACYGDGSDGAATLSGTTVLARNMYYTSLTIPSGAILVTGGFGLFVAGTLTVAGTLQSSGLGNGNAGQIGTYGAGAAGGKSGTATTAGASTGTLGSSLRFGGVGGNGGAGGGGLAGGSGATGTVSTVFPRTETLLTLGAVASYNGGGLVFTAVNGGAGGGQGGGDGTTYAGGNGGGGGGVLPVFAKTIVVQTGGQIVCAGGNGAAGTGGNAGGGGGGGGGTVLAICDTYSGTSATAPGGTGGPGSGTGVAGAAGSAGAVYLLQRS